MKVKIRTKTQLKVLARSLRFGYPANYPSLKERELIAKVLRAHGVKELRCLSYIARLALTN